MAIEIADGPLYPDEFLLQVDLPADHANKAINDLGLLFAGPNIAGNSLYVFDKMIYPSSHSDKELPELKLTDLYDEFQKREEYDIGTVRKEHVFENLPDERKTKAVSLEAIRDYASNFRFIPEYLLTDDFLVQAAESNGMILTYIDKSDRTDEMYWAAVESYPDIYKEIPNHLKVEGLHELMVRENGFNLRLLDEKDRTPRICEIALESFPDLTTMESYEMIRYIPHPDICRSLLENLGPYLGAYSMLKAIDPKIINHDIAIEAIEQDISCVALIPPSIIGKEIPHITEQERNDIDTIATDPFMDTFWYERLPPERKTEIVSRAAVNTRPRHLNLVPEKYLNREMYRCAIKADPLYIHSVKPEFKDIRMLLEAFNIQDKKYSDDQYIILEGYAGSEANIPDICKQVVDASPLALRFIPEGYRTSELCREALHHCTSPSDYEIVMSIRYPDVCLEALDMDIFTGKAAVGAAKLMELMKTVAIDKKVAEKGISLDGHCIRHIPRHLQTEQMLFDAMKTTGPLILLSHNISDRIKTPRVYEAASHLDPKKFNFIPERRSIGIFRYASWKEVYDVSKMQNMESGEAERYFHHLKPEERTKYVSNAAVDIAPGCLCDVPYESQTKSMILKVLEVDGNYLRYVKPSEITDEMYLVACKNQPHLISSLPTHLVRYDMCMDAVDSNCYNLKSVPAHLMSKELCEHAIYKHESRYLEECKTINDIPYPDIRLQMLKEHPTITFAAIKELRPAYLNKDIASLAIEQDIRCVSVIPKSSVDNWPQLTKQEEADILDISRGRCYESAYFSNLPESRRTECVSFAAVSSDPMCLVHVPAEHISDRVILAALCRDGDMIRLVPTEKRTEVMYLTALRNDHGDGVLKEIPPSMLTPDLCQLAVEVSGYNLEYVPEEMKTPEMCRTSLYSSADLGYEDCVILQDIPFSDVCLEGLKGYVNGRDANELLQLVHPKAFDATIANWFVEQDPFIFNALPGHLQTEKLAEAAAKNIDRDDLIDAVKNCENMSDVFQQAVMKEAASYLPSKSILAELCLKIEKESPGFWNEHPNMLPKSVGEECNVFTLNNKLEKVISDDLSPEDVNRLFHGKPLFVHEIKTPQGVLENQYVQLNEKDMTLTISPNKQCKQDTKQSRIPEQKKENKSPDTPKEKNNHHRKMKF